MKIIETTLENPDNFAGEEVLDKFAFCKMVPPSFAKCTPRTSPKFFKVFAGLPKHKYRQIRAVCKLISVNCTVVSPLSRHCA